MMSRQTRRIDWSSISCLACKILQQFFFLCLASETEVGYLVLEHDQKLQKIKNEKNIVIT